MVEYNCLMKPVIAHGSGGQKDRGFTVRWGKNGPVVDGSHGGVHLAIFPRRLVKDDKAYEVHITTETPEGNPDWGHTFNSIVLDIKPEDVEEVADTYMRRLRDGVPPTELFRDIEEANIIAMREVWEKLRVK